MYTWGVMFLLSIKTVNMIKKTLFIALLLINYGGRCTDLHKVENPYVTHRVENVLNVQDKDWSIEEDIGQNVDDFQKQQTDEPCSDTLCRMVDDEEDFIKGTEYYPYRGDILAHEEKWYEHANNMAATWGQTLEQLINDAHEFLRRRQTLYPREPLPHITDITIYPRPNYPVEDPLEEKFSIPFK